MSILADIQAPDIRHTNKDSKKFGLTKIQNLFYELNAYNIRYCHWKSNILLTDSLTGQTDIDILVDRNDARIFQGILNQLEFRPAITRDGDPFPSVEHYYAIDGESGILVHVHAYYRVITGESLTKNYRFPIEEMLLNNTREVDAVRVPVISAELVVFILRIMLKHTSIVELLLLARYWKQVSVEIKWLLESDPIDETLNFVNSFLPTVDSDLFSECITAILSPVPVLQRVHLGFKLRSQLKIYKRHSYVRNWLSGIRKFTIMSYRKFAKSQKSISLRSGGAVIAFVGSEATGKSTLLNEMREWLGEHFAVDQVHVGKPPSTLLTFIPNFLLPLLRLFFPTSRTTYINNREDHINQTNVSRKKNPLIFSIRSTLLAYDRRSLLSKAYGQSANGTIFLCDRYPSLIRGAPDSPQLSKQSSSTGRVSIRNRLAKGEAKLYSDITPPDLIIYLSAPIEVTISRNATRNKQEPEDYVRRRHAISSNLEFGNTSVYKINTDQPLDQTILDVKKAIWNAL